MPATVEEKSQKPSGLIGTTLQAVVEHYPESFPEVQENLLNVPKSPQQPRSTQEPNQLQRCQQTFDTPNSHVESLKTQAETIQKIFPDLFAIE